MRPSYLRGLCAAAIVIALAGCATSTAPPPRQAVARPTGGVLDVGLATQASAFEAYTRRAAAIDPAFSDPGEIGQALRTAAGYEPRQLEAGMIAYAALAAMQEPAFVAAVRGNREAVRRVATDPDAAMELPGASAAAARASGALARRGEALADAGQRMKREAYTIQHQAWSRARVPNGPQRLAAVKAAAGYRPDPADRARLVSALAESGRRGGNSSVVARSVAVAALTVLGEDSAARGLMSAPSAGQCLRSAKLNYHQCLAAAGTHYEDIYCLGVHAMTDPGQCVVDALRPARVRRAAID